MPHQANPLFELAATDLLRSGNLVDGDWVQSESGATFSVSDPYDGREIARVPACDAADARRAIEAARRALPGWRNMLARERAAILRRLYDLMIEHVEDLAVIMTVEQGKPLAESRGEIRYAASFIEWYAEEAKRIYGEIIPATEHGRRLLVRRESIGVFAAITPWNFPTAMITRKAGPAWAAGCTGVIRPASQTPLSALALAFLAQEAGLPRGVCNVITGDPEPIGAELTSNPVVRKLSFTGSTAVGAKLAAQSASTIKKLSLELGGNAPLIVFDDADLHRAVEGAVAAKFRNAGQTCVCANRILVQSGIYDAFVSAFAARVGGLRMGSGLDAGTEIGPLIDDRAVAKVRSHIDDAVSRGARVVCGGGLHPVIRLLHEPTVLVDVPTEAVCFSEETFGPIAPIFRFGTEEEALAMANDSDFGLAAYVFTRDLGRAFRVLEALEVGIVGVNEGIISTEVAPFGGVKQSGLGREGSRHGIEDYLELKYVALGL